MSALSLPPTISIREMGGVILASKLRDLRIRALTADDYDDLLGLWRDAGLPYRPNGRDSRSSIKNQMEHDPELFIGVFQDGRLVGSVIATFDGRKGWINRLAVAPQSRRKGVARLLVERAELALRKRGAEVVAALVERENSPSLALLQECGYKVHNDIVYLSKRDSEDV